MSTMQDQPQPSPHMPMACVWHIGGKIVAFGHAPISDYDRQSGPDGAEREVIPLATFAAMSSPEAWCWDGAAVVPRQSSSIAASTASIRANGVDEVAITGIPAGSRLRLSGAITLPDTPLDDDHLSLTTTQPGRLMVRIICPPPYLNWEHAIDAT